MSGAPWWLLLLAAVVGLAAGSLAGTAVGRVPVGRPLFTRAAACASGVHALRSVDQVPVWSWVRLRGRCRYCPAAIPVRYLALEVATPAAFVALTWATGAGWHLPALWYLAWLTLTLSVIDVAVHRLPDHLVLPGYAFTAALLVLASFGEPISLLRAGAGALALGLAYAVVMVIYPPGMGFGDVKLAVICGAFLAAVSWPVFAVGSLAAFAVGGILAAWTMVRGGPRALPFGPSMLAGVWVGLLAGEPLWRGYLSLAGL